MKKLLSTIMAVVMLLSLVPMAVAEEGVTAENAVAQIGDQYYKTLEDAVSKAADGATIKLLRDSNGDGIVVKVNTFTNQGLTVDFNGHTYSVGGELVGSAGTGTNAFQLNKNNKITFKNGTIAGVTEGTKPAEDTPNWHGAPAIVIQNYCDLTLDNMTVTGGDETVYTMSNNNGNVTIKDTTINEGEAKGYNYGPFAFDVCRYAEYPAVSVTVTGDSVINGDVEVSGTIGEGQSRQLTINSGMFNGEFKVSNGVPANITIYGGTFTDLASAVKYAANGATITLAGDAKGDVVIPEGKTITLDLGGHKLTNVKDHTIVNNGTLTITGTGTVDNVTHARAALVNYGTAILNGGNFTRSKENPENNKNNGGGNSYYTILNDKGATMTINEGVTVSNVGHFSSMIRNGGDGNTAAVSTMTINGGTFSGGINTVKNDENGVLTINGGDFSNTSQVVIMNWNKAAISDGTFEANASAEAVLFTAKYLESRAVGELKIEGGMYVCAANQKLIVDRYNNDDQYLGTAVISAGAFNVAPDAKYLAEGMIVVPGVKDAPYSVQPAKRTNEEENTETEVKVDGDNVTVTVTDKTTGTTTETVTDTTTGATTETKTETKVEGNVTTKTETVTEKNAAGETTKVTESKIVENNENGKTETKTTVDGKTVKTDVTVNQAPATASDVTLNAKALEGKAAGTETSSVTVDKASLSELKNDTVKGVIIETDQATLKLNKDAVKTMEGNVPANSKMTLDVTVTEETNATTAEIEKVKVEVTAKNEAGQNVFPENTANTNGLINITIPYTGNAKYLDLWYVAANGSASYMGRFPVVNGFVSFDVKHFSQYDLIPVASSGSSVIKTGAGSSAASTTQTVTTDLTPGSITKVTVDGKVVDAKYYTVSGSNVTFTAEFLKTLKNGSHTVTVENATKIAKGVFTVNNPTTAQSPTTADAGIALYAGMAIASVMGTGVVFTSRKRKNH